MKYFRLILLKRIWIYDMDMDFSMEILINVKAFENYFYGKNFRFVFCICFWLMHALYVYALLEVHFITVTMANGIYCY